LGSVGWHVYSEVILSQQRWTVAGEDGFHLAQDGVAPRQLAARCSGR